MTEPTQEQIEEFWEWCEWEQETDGWYKHPTIVGATYYHYESQGKLPLIDLNNLFKYAVPIRIKKLMDRYEVSEEIAYDILFEQWLEEGYDTLALFWAIYKTLGDKK